MLWGEENAEQHILCDYPQEMRERSKKSSQLYGEGWNLKFWW